MPDIQYKSTSCGPAGSFQPGDTRYGVPKEEADALVAGGYAIFVRAPVREQATAAPVEQAVATADPVIQQPQPGRSAPKRGR
jgi:hypothetical protein